MHEQPIIAKMHDLKWLTSWERMDKSMFSMNQFLHPDK